MVGEIKHTEHLTVDREERTLDVLSYRCVGVLREGGRESV